MSFKIKIFFEEFQNPELNGKLKSRLDMTRLVCGIRFKGKDVYGETELAIVDTGAPLSVIPLRMWEDALVTKLAEHTIRGIVPKEECSIPVVVGKVKCILLDEENVSREFEIIAYLALTNKVPLILGFKDLLEKSNVYFDFSKRAGYIKSK